MSAQVIPKIIPNNIDKSALYKATKPCSLVQKTDKGIYTVCSRDVCTFAHYIEEFRILPCNYFTNCRNFNCKYLHFNETNEAYYKRTRQVQCVLPTRKEYEDSKDFYSEMNRKHKFIITLQDDDIEQEDSDNENKEICSDVITFATTETELSKNTVLRFPKEFMELDGVKEILFLRSMTGMNIELV